MTSERANPFKELATLASSKPVKKPVNFEAIERISQEENFPSRQAAKPAAPLMCKRRVYRTGRNQQFNIKVTAKTVERFYRLADKHAVPLGELMDLALDALERADK